MTDLNLSAPVPVPILVMVAPVMPTVTAIKPAAIVRHIHIGTPADAPRVTWVLAVPGLSCSLGVSLGLTLWHLTTRPLVTARDN